MRLRSQGAEESSWGGEPKRLAKVVHGHRDALRRQFLDDDPADLIPVSAGEAASDPWRGSLAFLELEAFLPIPSASTPQRAFLYCCYSQAC